MPKNKPSFFERLTGTLQAEEEIKKEESSQQSSRPSFVSNFNQSKKIPLSSSDLKTQGSKIPNQERENWLPEPEGQLAIDVYQTPSDIVIKSTIAGVADVDLDVSLTNDMVTIKGRRQLEEDIKADDYYYQECYWGTFSRSIILPTDVLADQAAAVLKNGILTIRLPKADRVRTQKIKVETA